MDLRFLPTEPTKPEPVIAAPNAALTSEEVPFDVNTPRMWIQPHYTSFNGLRALAVFLVFLTHFGDYILPAGFVGRLWIGVDLFFVLSGFLITGILYDSLHDPHYFRNFYIRRALRIFPIFYAFFLLLFILTPILHLSYERNLVYYFFYLGNLLLPFLDIPHHNPTIILYHVHGLVVNANIGYLWSLCVEEQFYLIWPAVIWFVRSRTRLLWICGAVSLASLLLRIFLETQARRIWLDQSLLQWSTYTRLDTLLIGAWFALWLRERPLSTVQLRKLSAFLFIGSSIAVAFALAVYRLLLTMRGFSRFIWTGGYTLIALAAAGLLLRSLDDTSRISRLLRIRTISAFGAISYGFYFFHAPFMYEFKDLAAQYAIVHRFAFMIPFIAFGTTLLLAKLSFRYLESPFLRLKSRLAPQWVPRDLAKFSGESGDGVRGALALHVPEPRP